MERRKADFPGDLLIVIALLLIMAATAIPNLLRAAIADHESLAASPSATPGTAGISRQSPSPRH
jgi:hypothetical protein